jgi:hypothetical protein
MAGGELIGMADAFGKDGVTGNQDGNPIADGEAGSTGGAEEGVLHTVEGGLPVGVERTAEVGEKLVDHRLSGEGRMMFAQRGRGRGRFRGWWRV